MLVGSVGRIGTYLRRSLSARVLALTLAAFAIIAVPACFSFLWIVNATVVKLGTLFAEKQILYDRYRGLETLMREVGLAETLARAPAVIDWARDEEHAAKRARGIAELEHFRHAFRDRSYFFVVDGSKNYYYNDALGSFTGSQLRYTLAEGNPRDGWYFRTRTLGPGCQLNVDHDDVLAVTKVWINCVVEANGRTLGIIGTGIDLSTFIQEVVNAEQPGVESLFVDRSGAIQAIRDQSRIDFHSLTKLADDRKTIFGMLDAEEDRASLSRMFDYVSAGPERVQARFATMDGRRVLVGVGHLDRLGWYNVTLMDIDQIIDRRLFLPIAALFALMMILAAGVVTWLFRRSVLDRLSRVERAFADVEAGREETVVAEKGEDEVARLSQALSRMAGAVGRTRHDLEDAVRERTRDLERIAFLDGMTGIPNRRAFNEAFSTFISGEPSTSGLILFDVDHFKTINDTYGHSAGDEVIKAVALRLMKLAMPSDVCARWGGDEFVLFLRRADRELLEAMAARISVAMVSERVEVRGDQPVAISVSLGAHLVPPGAAFDEAMHCADMALYAAKRGGRNRWVIYDPSIDPTTTSKPGKTRPRSGR